MPVNAYKDFLSDSIMDQCAQVFLRHSLLAILKHPEINEDLQKSLVKFEEVSNKKYSEPIDYFSSRIFLSYISSFESFLMAVIFGVVKMHPKKIGSTLFRLDDIIDAENMDILIQRAIEEHVNKLMYKKPKDYLNDICGLLSISSDSLSEWVVFVEAKARRDLGMHNNWVCNKIYLNKVNEAGLETTFEIGDRVTVTHEYTQGIHEKLSSLARKIFKSVEEVHKL